MKGTLTAVCIVALVALLLADTSSAVRKGKCRSIARRQRRLAARDDFPDASCDDSATVSALARAINAECNDGLCASLSRGKCSDAVRELLVVTIFPDECDDVPPCVPETCSPSTCRSTVATGLSYPANCPQTCGLVGFCTDTVCSPVLPRCGSGQKVDEASCSCVTTATVAPATTAAAPSTAPVVPTATPAPDCTDCCMDSDPFGGVDTNCTTTSPFCADASGMATTEKGECFVCQVGGIGCNETHPVCAFSQAGFVGERGTYGKQCFFCLADDNNPQTGCEAGERCDADPNQAGTECV